MSLRQAFSDKSSEELDSIADSNDGDFEVRVTDMEEEEEEAEAAEEEDAVRTNKKKKKIRHRWAGMLGEEEENTEEDADAAQLSSAAAAAATSGEAAAHVRYVPVYLVLCHALVLRREQRFSQCCGTL